MKNLKPFAVAALLTISFATPFAFAATDGDSGTTSSATSDISVVVPKLVKITDVGNLAQTYDGSAGGFDQSDNVCIYSNMDTSTAEYTVRITGSGNPAASASAGFYVGNAGTDQEIPYEVKWNDQTGTAGETSVTHNVDLEDQTGFSNEVDCSDVGGTNANFHVTMGQSDLLSVRPATYTGTITVLITPQ